LWVTLTEEARLQRDIVLSLPGSRLWTVRIGGRPFP
jgi:hypothetical protein